MANIPSLIPPVKGERRNPFGRGKGIPNRGTIAKFVLGMSGKPPEEVLRNLTAMYPVFFNKKSKKYNNELIATIRLWQKAIIKGDVPAYNAVMDSAYGKAKESIQQSGEFTITWEK